MKKHILFLFLFISFNVNFSINSHAQWVCLDTVSYYIEDIATSNGNIYLCVLYSGFNISSDSGYTFQPSNTGLPNLFPKKVIARDSLLILATDNSIYKSINHGGMWTLASYGLPGPYGFNIKDIMFRGDSILLASWGSGVYCSLDFCETWFPINNGLIGSSYASLFANGNRLFVGSYYENYFGSAIYVSDDNASTWIPKSTGIPFYYPNQYPIITDFEKVGQTLFASTEGCNVLRSENNGESWLRKNTPCSTIVKLLSVNNDLICGTSGFGIIKSEDNGNSWSYINEGFDMPQDGSFDALCKFGPYIYAGSLSGKIFRRPISELATSTPELFNKITCVVSPNPISNVSRIILANSARDKYSLEIFNIVGQCVLKSFGLDDNELVLRKSDFHPGHYIFRVSGGKQAAIFGKFIVK
jgi:hypothetical protein